LKRQERREEEVFKGQRKPQTDRQTAADEKKKKKRAVWQAQAHAPSLSSSLLFLLCVSFSPTFCVSRGDVSSLLSFPISTKRRGPGGGQQRGRGEWWGPQTGTY